MKQPIVLYVGPKGEYSDKIVCSTIGEVYEYCKDKKELAIDIETGYKFPKNSYRNEDVYKPGLDPHLTRIVMLQIGDRDRVYVIDTRTVNITVLLPLFQIKDIVWVGANLKFEAKHLQYNYGVLFHKIHDVMLVDMNLTNGLGWSMNNKQGLRYSLEAMVGRYLNIKPLEQRTLFNQDQEEDIDAVYIDKSTRMGFLHIGDRLFTEKQILYGADDIVYPLEIKKKQKLGYKGYTPTIVNDLENEFCLVLADIELKGMSFNKEQWLSVYNRKKAQYESRLQKLNEYVEAKYSMFCITDLFHPTPKCNIEWSSSKQVIKLFKHLGICPQERSKQTKRVEYTVGAKSLLKLLPNDYKDKYEKNQETDIVEDKDLILNYLLLSATGQAVTTFGEEWLKYIHPITGRIHSSFKQILNTGRMSSQNPNCQNIPSEEEYRKAFTAPAGYKLINADYSSQESRILAEVSKDKAMVSFFNDGHPIHGSDYHSFTATKMFSLMRNEPNLIVSKETHKEERNAAKNISFKIAYGGSAYTLKDDFGVEEEVAQEFIDSYMAAFPALDKYFTDCKAKAVKDGYIEIDPITGRRYWEPTWEYMNQLSKDVWKYYPSNYRDLPADKKEEVKIKLKKDHPEIAVMWNEYFRLQGELQRAAMNYRIQGLAGSQTKLAAVMFRRYQIENNLRDVIYLVSLIHDEVLAEVKEQYAEQGRKLIELVMVEGANKFCKRVKMGAESHAVEFWHH